MKTAKELREKTDYYNSEQYLKDMTDGYIEEILDLCVERGVSRGAGYAIMSSGYFNKFTISKLEELGYKVTREDVDQYKVSW